MPAFLKRSLYCTLTACFVAYSIYVYTTGTRARQSTPPTEQVRLGQQLFQEHNCVACHQFYGLGGYMGPDLTNIVSTPGKGPAYAAAFIRAGTGKMPNFHLSEGEIDALVAFLGFVDASGQYPADDRMQRWYGVAENNSE